MLAARGFKQRDEVGIALSTENGSKAASNLAIDDTVAQGLFRGIVGRWNIRPFPEDEKMGLVLGVPSVEPLTIRIIRILAEQLVKYLIEADDLGCEMGWGKLVSPFAKPDSAIEEGLQLKSPATAISVNSIL